MRGLAPDETINVHQQYGLSQEQARARFITYKDVGEGNYLAPQPGIVLVVVPDLLGQPATEILRVSGRGLSTEQVHKRFISYKDIGEGSFLAPQDIQPVPPVLLLLGQPATEIGPDLVAGRGLSMEQTRKRFIRYRDIGDGEVFFFGPFPDHLDATVNQTGAIGVLTLSALGPGVQEAFATPAGILTLTAGTNAITEGLPASAGILTLSAGTHSVTLGGDISIAQVVGALSLVGGPGQVQLGFGPTPGTLTLTGPAHVLNEILPALVGTLNLTAISPAIVESFSPQVGSASLAGSAPSFTVGVSPPAGILSLTAVAPTLVGGSGGSGVETSVRDTPHIF